MRHELLSLLAARGSSVLIQAGLLLWVARNTPPEHVGAFMAALAVAYVVVAVGDGGLQPMAIRDRAADRRPTPEAGTEAFRLASRLTLMLAIGTALVLPLVGASISMWHACGIAGLAWLERQFLGRLSLAIAVGRSTTTSGLLLLARVTTAGLMVLASLLGVVDQLGSYLGASILGMGASLCASIALFPQALDRDRSPWKELLHRARPFWWSNVWSQLRGIDAFLLGVVSGPTAVANYALPNRLGQALRIFPSVLSSLGQPAAVRGDTARLRVLDRATWITLLLGTGIWGLVAVFGQPVFLALVGPDYSDAFLPLIWITAAQIVNIPGIYLSGVLIGKGYEQDVARCDAIVTVVLLSGIGIGGATAGAMGASIALFVGLACQSVGVAGLRLSRGWF